MTHTIKLSTEDRQSLLEAMDWDADHLAFAADAPNDPYWLKVEERLAEILTREPNDWPTRGNTDYELHGAPGRPNEKPTQVIITDVTPRPPAAGAVTFQAVFDSHPERIQQETARVVEETVRRNLQGRRSRSW